MGQYDDNPCSAFESTDEDQNVCKVCGWPHGDHLNSKDLYYLVMDPGVGMLAKQKADPKYSFCGGDTGIWVSDEPDPRDQ